MPFFGINERFSQESRPDVVCCCHLIPLGLQDSFDRSLDCEENILALNQLWHRAIHHAEPTFVRGMLDDIYPKRASFLQDSEVDPLDLVRFYGVEEIK